MVAGGMIAHARSSQIRNAEDRLLISIVLEPIVQYGGCLLISNVQITVVFIRYDSDLC